MTGTDMALMRLAATRGEVARRGLRGFPIARHAPALGEAVVNVGIPQSGVRDRYLRRSRCEILEQVDLEEGGGSSPDPFATSVALSGAPQDLLWSRLLPGRLWP